MSSRLEARRARPSGKKAQTQAPKGRGRRWPPWRLASNRGGPGQSNKGELSKIKVIKSKLSRPKTVSMSKEVAKAVRDAKILMGTLEEGE